MEGVTMRKYLAFFILLLVTAAAIAVPLAPIASGSKTMSCTSASSRTTIPSTITVGTTQQLELQNAGSAVIFVEVGDSSVAAVVATSYPILVGQSQGDQRERLGHEHRLHRVRRHAHALRDSGRGE
jgi:hypothetical protein